VSCRVVSVFEPSHQFADVLFKTGDRGGAICGFDPNITDQTTLQVISVEPGEAAWCLDILEEMFDHYYVKPTPAARKATLNATLAAAGKPPSKP
jgi:hypothetical protein